MRFARGVYPVRASRASFGRANLTYTASYFTSELISFRIQAKHSTATNQTASKHAALATPLRSTNQRAHGRKISWATQHQAPLENNDHDQRQTFMITTHPRYSISLPNIVGQICTKGILFPSSHTVLNPLPLNPLPLGRRRRRWFRRLFMGPHDSGLAGAAHGLLPCLRPRLQRRLQRAREQQALLAYAAHRRRAAASESMRAISRSVLRR